MTRASELEQAGRHADAAKALAQVVPQYPQDYALHLQLAWLHFNAAHYGRAEGFYEKALELSPESWEARLGLGWSLLRQGRKAEARPHFTTVLEKLPANTSARQGVEASKEGPALSSSPWGSLTFSSYQNHPNLLWALGALVSLPMTFHERWLLSASYRLGRFTIPGVAGRGGSSLRGFMQHEAFISAGATWPLLGVVAQYAYLYDGSTDRDHGHFAGLSGRVSPWGDIGLAANLSLYDDLTVVRVHSSYRLPLRPWLSVTPGFTVQVPMNTTGAGPSNSQLIEDSKALFSGQLEVLLRGKPGSIWFGGKLGKELRPADLDALAIYNIDQYVAFSLNLGGRLLLDSHWSLFVAYQLDRLEALDAEPDTNLHLFTLGVAWRPGVGERK